MTKNFTKKEFECKGGCEMPDDVYLNIVKLANQLQYLRDYLGKPIKINSGFRCESHNEKIGGVKHSQHLLGKAADIVVDGINSEFIYHYIQDQIDNGEMLQGGLGLYKTFVHYDIRGTKARWNG